MNGITGALMSYSGGAMQAHMNQLQQMQNAGIWDYNRAHQPFGGIGPQDASQIPQAAIKPQSIIKPKQEEKSMIKELRQDMQAFIKEHKSVIYWTLILYVVDHYCLDGAMKARLQKMVQNLVGKVEAKLDKATL